jgi:hypothetical protein
MQSYALRPIAAGVPLEMLAAKPTLASSRWRSFVLLVCVAAVQAIPAPRRSGDPEAGHGDEVLYVATTTTNAVYSINLATNQIQTFVSRATIDAATGLAVGNALMGKDEVTMFEMTGVVGKHLGPA